MTIGSALLEASERVTRAGAPCQIAWRAGLRAGRSAVRPARVSPAADTQRRGSALAERVAASAGRPERSGERPARIESAGDSNGA